MPTVVCLASNIYDESGEKHMRGAAFEASDDFIEMVLNGDDAAEREPRLTVVEVAKKRRAKKDEADNENC